MADADEPNIQSPLVFQCLRCKAIVGDSYSMVSSNAQLNIITLSSASNIKQVQGVFTSKSGADIGSTYYELKCSSSSCESHIGRYYLTTSSDLDGLRQKFSFIVDEISSYELGKAEVGRMLEISDAAAAPDTEPARSDTCLSCREVGEEIIKIQQVLVSVLERVEQLEAERAYWISSTEMKRPRL